MTKKGDPRKVLEALGRDRKVSVGIHEAEGAAEHKGAGASVVEVGAFHEFGFGVPRRSFIADWFDINEREAKQTLFQICKPAVTRPEYLDQGLARFAAWAVGQVQQRIAAGIEPALAESTIRQKHGKTTPLIDTGQLRASIRGRVA